MAHALALSPHLDDAAFSCGGTLARLAAGGWTVTLCTAFTRSVPDPTGFALACQLDKGLGAEVDYMALRRAEDAAACAALGARPLWLDLPEAPHRGYRDARALFAAPLAADHVAAPLAAALAPLLDPAPDLLLAPQAIGGHVDHVLLVRALRAVLPPGLPVLWWTDFPYSLKPQSHPARPFEAAMASLPERAIEGDATARLAACAAYRSQLGFQFGGTAGLAEALAAAGPLEQFRAEGEAAA
ncbi:PIG-L deacetylase family protein [Paracraurococcus lichenis]|uniref:PIG-L family deacetylase n=1 Tax=Paracraurococcus lichenis TaxID=3064888 RepID=A0ABT9E7M4_9PROT|nr:PIG-L family deacetylase [Paracraurococcus sp. LOR1-02]MDO9712179.1 PIG-L family deacetylase [Paracraurococcus sp. LOR1-02]